MGDGGGRNRARPYLFNHALEQLAQALGIEIRGAHSPPYTSKDNPIAYRLFPHLTRAGQGGICTRSELVKTLRATTTTKTGLTVDVRVLDQGYATGRKAPAHFTEQRRVLFDEDLPQWNYTIPPSVTSVGGVI